MARIKVLEVLEAAGGGALRHVVQIAQHLNRDEFDLTIALSTRRMTHPERTLAHLRELGARVETVLMKRRIRPVADLRALRRLETIIRRDGCDVLHAHSSKAGFLGRLAGRRMGVSRVYYTPHAFAFLRGGVRGAVYWLCERIGARFGGTLVAISDSERDLAVRNGFARPEEVRVIRNGIEPPEMPTPEQRREAREALGLPLDAFVVGTVGRLVRQKGCGYLVRAVPEVLECRPDVRFVFIGAGKFRARLGALSRRLGVEDCVRFAGYRDDAADLCAAMDVYVQPALWEGLPYSVLDAMGRGLPVVASEVPGNIDLVRHNRTGLLVPPRDASALARAILDLRDDPDKRRHLGRAARELILAEHRLDDFIRSIEALYRGDSLPA